MQDVLSRDVISDASGKGGGQESISEPAMTVDYQTGWAKGSTTSIGRSDSERWGRVVVDADRVVVGFAGTPFTR